MTKSAKMKKIAQKSLACVCAATLTACMFPCAGLAAIGSGVEDGKEPPVEEATLEQTVESAQNHVAESAPEPQDELVELAAEGEFEETSERLPNSWRYSNGVPIVNSESSEVSSLAADNAWSLTPSGYVNESGGVISGAVTKGVDISEWQGDINWEAVKASDVDFVIIRCSYGTGHLDKKWERNVSECERLGIPYGVYLYSIADSAADARKEAEFVISLLKGHSPTLPVYYDLEENEWIGKNSFLTEISKAFCQTIENAGYRAGIYSSLSWWNNYLTDSCFSQWERWVAQWNNQCEYKGEYHVWQCASDGRVSGISGYVDVDFEMGWTYLSGSVKDEYVAPETPYSQVIDDGAYEIVSKVSSAASLDVASGSYSAGANIQIYESNQTPAQSYEVIRDASTGCIYLKNTKSGMYVGLVSRSNGFDKNVIQKNFDAGDNSLKWILLDTGEGCVEIVSAANKRYALDIAGGSVANGTNVQVYSRNNSAAQRFAFVNLGEEDKYTGLEDGVYAISSTVDGSYAFDVVGASLNNGEKVQLYGANGTHAQAFRFTKTSDGYYRITNLYSGLPMAVANGGVTTGSQIVQGDEGTPDRCRLWRLKRNGDGSITLFEKGTNMVIDLAAGKAANGTKIQLWTDNGTAAQRFTVTPVAFESPVAAGQYVMRSSANPTLSIDSANDSDGVGANVELCDASSVAGRNVKLSVDGQGLYKIEMSDGRVMDACAAEFSNGTNIHQYSSNDTLAQRWIIERGQDGLVTVRSALCSSRVLDITAASFTAGANIQLYESNGTAAQRFALSNDSSFGESPREITCALSNLMVIDVAGGSADSGANIQLYESNGTAAQQFKLSYDKTTGFYTVVNASTGLVLDVAGASTGNGTNIHQYASNGTRAQQWLLLPRGDGFYVFASALDATMVVDVAGASTNNATNIQLYSSNGTAAQGFVL